MWSTVIGKLTGVFKGPNHSTTECNSAREPFSSAMRFVIVLFACVAMLCVWQGPRNTLPVHHDNNGAYHMQLVYLNGETVKQTCAKLTSENTKLRKENKDLNDKVVMLTEQQAQMQKKYEAVEWMVEMLSKKFSAIEGKLLLVYTISGHALNWKVLVLQR